jgi:hypothetical protein
MATRRVHSLYLNGYRAGQGNYLSVFVAIMRGDNNNTFLTWPFQKKVTLTLIDQCGQDDISDTAWPDPSSLSCQRPKNDKNIAFGYPKYVSLNTLDEGGYIRDDTMSIK